MKIKIYLLTVLAGVLFSSFASAQKTDYDVTPGIDFSKYKTYKWQRADDARYPGDDFDQMLVRSIDSELKLKGLTRTEDEGSDLYVIYQLAIVEDMQWSSFRTEIGWAAASVTGLYSMPGATTNSSNAINIGSLFIDIYDVAQKKRVWQAHARKTLDPSKDPKKNEKNTQKAIAKILKYYPPAIR